MWSIHNRLEQQKPQSWRSVHSLAAAEESAQRQKSKIRRFPRKGEATNRGAEFVVNCKLLSFGN